MRTVSLAVLVWLQQSAGHADEPAPSTTSRPAYEWLLTGDDAARALELQMRITAAEQGDRNDEVISLHEQLVALRTKKQGAVHWEVVNAKLDLDAARALAKLLPEQRQRWRMARRGAAEALQLESRGEFTEALGKWEEFRRTCESTFGPKHRETASSLNGLALCLNALGRYTDAQPLLQQALAVRRELLGEKHPETAIACTNLGENLDMLGNYREAEDLHRKAIGLCRELLGDLDFNTASCCNNLAYNLSAQARYAEAQPLFDESLDVTRKLLGEDDPFTAGALNNVALNLSKQGKHADAERYLRSALDLRRRIQGEQHPDTATGYANLAQELDIQGKHADAQPLHQRGLDLRRELLGEEHPDTGGSYNNVAANLSSLGKTADAQWHFQKALDIHRTRFGDVHPDTARDYFNLAGTLFSQGRYVEAQPLFKRALELHMLIFTEKHPYTIYGFRQLARNLQSQGQHADAALLFAKALDLCRELLGEAHANTADAYSDLARNLDARKQYAEAIPLHRRAIELDVMLFGEKHPATAFAYSSLAGNLCLQGKYAEAQPLLEKALASFRESLGDRHPYTACAFGNVGGNLRCLQKLVDSRPFLEQAVAAYEAARLGHADRVLDRAIFGALTSPYSPLAITEARLGNPAAAWNSAERDLARGLNDESAHRHRSARALELQSRQCDLNERLQLVQPRIVELYVKQSPSPAERIELVDLQAERQRVEDQLSDLSAELSQGSLASLRDVQADLLDDGALLLWIDGADPAGQIQEHWGCVVRHTGDPHWEQLNGTGPDGAWTKDDDSLSSELCAAVAGNAALTAITELAGKLQAQRLDPLAPYLDGVKRLYVVPVNEMAGVPIDVVTDKHVISYVPSGTFLARTDDRPHQKGTSLLALGDAVYPAAATTAETPLLLTVRASSWAELPGTSVEVARLLSLAGADQSTALTRSDASEQSLEQLRLSGKLKDFRYLHFATHGEPNNARAFESALILAQDQITGDIPKGGGKYYDGRLTANEVLENWELNADLVTLSACESALGRPGGGDGLLGFAQAFLVAGARSVCLSLWKVDDTATALLMDRFYQNLLGKRAGLDQPMPKAEALAEAKQWLRTLSRDEAGRLWTGMKDGVDRGKGEAPLSIIPAEDEYPYSHPRYWAAFILIGDPG